MKNIRTALNYFGIMPESEDAELLRLILSTAVDTIGADEGSLLLRDETNGDLRFAMTVGAPEGSPSLIGERVPVGQGVVQLSVATREVQVGAPTFDDIKQTHRSTGGPEAVIAAPLVTGGKVIGALTGVSFARDRRFAGDEAKIYGRLATIAAVLIEQHQHISGKIGRVSIQASAATPRHNKELSIIDQALSRIAAKNPDVLGNIAAIIANFEAALRR